MQSRVAALAGATLVSIIYGVTFTIAKDVMPAHIQPFGFILIRVAGACLLFWITFFLLRFFGKIPKEKLSQADIPVVISAAFFGVALNMLTFFKGLSYTSPISAAVLMVSTPLIVMILSAILLKERINLVKSVGIILGLAGTILLIVGKKAVVVGSNENLGNLLVFINALSYGFYLIIVKKLMDKYNAFTFVGWIYTIGFLMVLPFGFNEFQQVPFSAFDFSIWWKIVFIIAGSTYLTYLLNLVTMRKLSPTIVAVFIYLQPVFAAIFAIGLGKDALTTDKLLAGALIFIGVALSVKKKK
ncbi:DMT family transporter [Flavobacterium aurantiibacter]|uniref:EamA family transporter n=1 Tax=Flavobacterium aurantiibacter TaxID=2023067 RepID=A0A255ZAV1_9FLAO|nr:DMT family transporter [Flavobacterium aurantiibacter]OYQ38579.1 EamA family transporter [Flavobacterium aurantiibacter]